MPGARGGKLRKYRWYLSVSERETSTGKLREVGLKGVGDKNIGTRGQR